jgi:predicted RNA-binding protein with RPS1 domain
MINIWLRFFDLETKNKHIIDAKDKFVQNLHGALKKEQKLKVELQNKNNENNQLAKL